MASLKEVKRRIVSVESTKKITQARQMISSAKLHQSHLQLDNSLLYKQGVDALLDKLHPAEFNIPLPFMRTSGKGKVAIVILSSNSGMCGAFNANMIKYMHTLPEQYPGEALVFLPIGHKIREALLKEGFQLAPDWPAEKDKLADKATFADATREVVALMEQFQAGIYKKVVLVYYRFQSTSRQVIEKEQL
ncbi:MAG: F0F1 ATP synthase subunit gamma, partial [Tannerellaceae bacterium]|nr:F0F1 ATP synthase subunit gamma [Tannerellaceae bacterium]